MRNIMVMLGLLGGFIFLSSIDALKLAILALGFTAILDPLLLLILGR